MLFLVNCVLCENSATKRENAFLVRINLTDVYQTPENDLFSEMRFDPSSIHFVSSLENRILEIEKWLYPLRHSSSCRVGGDWYLSTSVSSSANFTFIRLSIFSHGVRTARGYYRGITAKWRAALPCRQNKTTLFILPEICFCLPFPLSVRPTAHLPIFVCSLISYSFPRGLAYSRQSLSSSFRAAFNSMLFCGFSGSWAF